MSTKRDIGRRNCLYPMPVVLVGAMVAGRANFATVAHVGIVDFDSISVSLGRRHHTTTGIIENGTFSVNVPSARLVELVDYCGLVSGKNTDKTSRLTVLQGQLEATPLIEECPINMECRVVETIEMPKHLVFIGSIVRSHCNDDLLTDGVIDMSKLDPLLFSMEDKGYWTLAKRLADAWSVGKRLIR